MPVQKTEAASRHRLFLYLTEFIAGMSVMAVELGASRLLAPYFSSSQIVWTIIIATIMISMALGNVYGGRSADRNPDPDRLYRRLLLAAVWTALIPAVGKYLIVAIAGVLIISVSRGFLVLAAFLSCMVIFAVPCFLMGTCTPSLIRFAVSGADDSGRTAGTLGAFNTIGSIIGTFLPTFVTIPAIGTAVTFLVFSGLLLATALIWFIRKGTGRKAAVISVILFLAATVTGNRDHFAFWEQDLAYEGESIYNYLQVRDTDTSTILSTNVLFGVQSITMKDRPLTGLYYDYALAAPVMAENCENILILGMGTGTYARQCLRYFDQVKVTGVEIDEKITALSKEWFDAPEAAQVIAYDGRAYLDAVTDRYDVIMVDAYQDITIPFQMSSVEFFQKVRDHLEEGGVIVVNLNMKSDAGDSIGAYLGDTIREVFPYVLTVDVPASSNQELFASTRPISAETLVSGASSLPDEPLQTLLLREAGNLSVYEGGSHILTDDKAPVELLGMKVLDEMITEELAWYREIYKEEGLMGLIRSF